MRIAHYIDTDEVRDYCMRNNYFTKGNNEEYDLMFDTIKSFNYSQDVKYLILAAEMIAKHSDLDNSSDMIFEQKTIVFDLLNNCGISEVQGFNKE